ncbi:MAG: contractile injection system protein, VgrG/Pvc8 family [Betaproteobacteria bacterium]
MSGIDDLRNPLVREPNSSAFDGSPRCSLDMRIGPSGEQSLGGQSLKLQKFSGTESVSQPFEFHLEFQGEDLATVLSRAGRDWLIQDQNNRIEETFNLDNLVGQECTVLLGMAETDNQKHDLYPDRRPVEFFNGILTSVSMKPDLMYEATLKPSIARLSLQNHFRIFERMTALDVIAELLDSNDVSWDKSAAESIVKGLARYRRQNWIQSGETDFDFLQRLIQKNGLIYYFVHDEHGHRMVITDQTEYKKSVSPNGTVQELFLFYTKTGQETENHIQDFKFEQNLVSDRVDMMLAEKEPSWLTEQNAKIRTDHFQVAPNPNRSSARHVMNEVHMVSYGASQKEIDTKANKTSLRLSTATKTFSGSSSCPRLRPGFWFVVRETEAGDLIQDSTGAQRPSDSFENSNYGPGFLPIRPDVDGLGFVSVNVSHSADIKGSYSNQFSAIEKKGFPGPYQHQGEGAGTIIGKVVSNQGLDSGNRFLSKNEFTQHEHSFDYFPFDDPKQNVQYPESKGESNFTAQPGLLVQLISPDSRNTESVHWVRLAPHMTSIPEEGTYVLIGKSSDETEVPEIQQVIEQRGSKNIIRNEKYSVNASWGDSYSTSYGDSARLNFPNVSRTDFEQARKLVERKRDSKRFSDVSFSESNSSSVSFSTKSHSISVTSESPNSDPFHYLDAEDEAAELAYVQYSKSMTFGNTNSRSVHHGDSQNTSEQIGTSFSSSSNLVTVSESNTLDSISNSVVAAQVSNSTVGISNSVSETGVSNSVSIVGVSVSSSTTGESISVSETASSDSNSVTGISVSSSEVGVSESVSLTGLSKSDSITGVSTQTSLTGASSSQSVSLDESSIRAVGRTSSISSTGASLSIAAVGTDLTISSTGTKEAFIIEGGKVSSQTTAGVMEILTLWVTL